jgi:hypothetical protein
LKRSALSALVPVIGPSCVSDYVTPHPQECRPVLARQYDALHDCFLPPASLPALTFCQSVHSASTGTGEFTCILAPSGVAYRAWKDFAECLSTDAPGWSVYGLESPCAQSIEREPDSVCGRVVGGTTGSPAVSLPGASCADMQFAEEFATDAAQ